MVQNDDFDRDPPSLVARHPIGVRTFKFPNAIHDILPEVLSAAAIMQLQSVIYIPFLSLQ